MPKPSPTEPIASLIDDPRLEEMDVADLLELQQSLGTERSALLARQRCVQTKLDQRSAEMEQRRQAEAALLGQVNRAPAQSVFEVSGNDVGNLDEVIGRRPKNSKLKVEDEDG